MKKFTRSLFPILLLYLVLVVPKFSPVLAQSSHLTLDHSALEVNLSSPKISPDGMNIVLVVRKADFEQNRYVNALWMIHKDTKEARQLTHDRPGVASPEWTPDGQFITFIDVDNNRKRQVFNLPVQGGEAQQITSSKVGINSYKWSPDGQFLAYVEDDAAEEKEGIDKHNKSLEVGYDWYLADKAAVEEHLWISTSEGKNAYKLTKEDGNQNSVSGDYSWSSDSKKIVYGVKPRPHTSEFLNRTLQLIDLDTKQITILDNEPRVPRNSFFSPDGSIILYNKSTGREPFFNPDGIYSVDLNGVKSEDVILNVDRNFTAHHWFSDGSFLAGAPDKTRIRLWRGQLDGTYEIVNTNQINPSLGNMDVSKSDAIVFIGATSSKAAELYYMKDYQSDPEVLTAFNEALSGLNLGKVRSINWTTEDGFYADGVLTYPPDFSESKKYPLVLYIHGGPMGSSIENFNFFSQAMASKGWIVFEPNYRGSNNLGRAYQSAVINDAGEGPGKDVMAGIEAVKALGNVDESKIAVSGWSYGGYMTVWLTSHYQGWKAAVAGAAVTDWFDWYNMADLNVWSGFGLGGSPWLNDNAENYRRQSPITYAHQIKTPTLILSNTLDQRVTVTQSFKLFHNLKDNGVKTSFIAYPIPGHFPQDPVHRKDVYKRWISWIEDQL